MSETQQTVLITGATDGLGRATAILLAGEGYRVFAAGRSAEKRAALERLARERKLPLTPIEMDVNDDGSVERAVAEVESAAGAIDVLVNNAGIVYVAVMEEIRLEDLRRQFETNFFAIVRVTQRVLPRMRARGRGRIINMSSVAGKMALPVMGPYAATKHAVEGMSDALRFEVYPFGIDVILIEPGYIRTNIENVSTELSSAYVTAAEKSPYARIYANFLKTWRELTKDVKTTPEDCARVILGAIRDTPPKARYPVTRRAKIMTVMRRILSDKRMDRNIIRSFHLERGAK